MKDKNHMIISIHAKQKHSINSTSIYDEKSQQSGYRENIPQHNKGHIGQADC